MQNISSIDKSNSIYKKYHLKRLWTIALPLLILEVVTSFLYYIVTRMDFRGLDMSASEYRLTANIFFNIIPFIGAIIVWWSEKDNFFVKYLTTRALLCAVMFFGIYLYAFWICAYKLTDDFSEKYTLMKNFIYNPIYYLSYIPLIFFMLKRKSD